MQASRDRSWMGVRQRGGHLAQGPVLPLGQQREGGVPGFPGLGAGAP